MRYIYIIKIRVSGFIYITVYNCIEKNLEIQRLKKVVTLSPEMLYLREILSPETIVKKMQRVSMCSDFLQYYRLYTVSFFLTALKCAKLRGLNLCDLWKTSIIMPYLLLLAIGKEQITNMKISHIYKHIFCSYSVICVSSALLTAIPRCSGTRHPPLTIYYVQWLLSLTFK